MRVLVTGGAGFIGWHLCHTLAERGDSVTCFDILDPLSTNPDLGSLPSTSGLSVVTGDVCDLGDVMRACADHDVVVHGAAQAGVDRANREPLTTFSTNAGGTAVVLEACRRTRVPRVHYISTDEVFGSVDDVGFDESSRWWPRNPYSAGKAGGQGAVLAWGNTFRMHVTITNATNTYGPRQAPDKVIPRFIVRGLLGKSLPIYGEGDQVREWLHVEDHCRAILTVLEQGNSGETYCIGGGERTTNLEVARAILRHLALDDAKLERVPDRAGHDRKYAVQTNKLRSLGWAPRVSFDAGLRETVEWYRNNATWWEYYVQSGWI